MAASHSPPPDAWVVCGTSVRGASHARDGLPNQDAIVTWVPPGGARVPVIVAIADGHGGARHFRSAIGARFTVETTVELMRSLAARIDEASDAERSRIAAVEVPKGIVSVWTERVRSHLSSSPITAAEWAGIETAEGWAALDAVRADPLLAYGATALAAMVTERCVILMQLGDGDILAVGPDGTTTRPLPSDERLVGNRTTSICRPDAERDFRCIALEAGRVPLSLLLLSSDGYANSFLTDHDFLQVGRDLQDMIRQDGIGAVGALLPGILEHASANGSGDDITLGLLLRLDGLEPERGGHVGSDTWGDAVEPAPPGDAAVRELSPLRAPMRFPARHVRNVKGALAATLIVAMVVLGWWVGERFLARASAGTPTPNPWRAEFASQAPRGDRFAVPALQYRAAGSVSTGQHGAMVRRALSRRRRR